MYIFILKYVNKLNYLYMHLKYIYTIHCCRILQNFLFEKNKSHNNKKIRPRKYAVVNHNKYALKKFSVSLSLSVCAYN